MVNQKLKANNNNSNINSNSKENNKNNNSLVNMEARWDDTLLLLASRATKVNISTVLTFVAIPIYTD